MLSEDKLGEERMCDKKIEDIRERAKLFLHHPAHHPHFTDHSVNHSDRILAIIKQILKNQSLIKLDNNETFILHAASYLHDIGMQIPTSKLFTYRNLEELLSESKLNKQDIANDKLLANFIRKWHHLFSEYMIKKSATGWNDIDLGLNKLHPAQVLKIALVAKAHRRINLYNNKEYIEEGGVRLQLLAALLRLADAIDCDRRRIDLDRLAILEPISEDRIHWFFHYCVEKVELKDFFIQIHACVPSGWLEAFKSIFIYDLWKEYYYVLEILKTYKIVLVWAPSRVKEEEMMDSKFQPFDPTGGIKTHIIQKSEELRKNKDLHEIITILGDEKNQKPKLEFSPYYFTGVKKFTGVKIRQFPDGAYACSYSIFDNPEAFGKAIWISSVVKKGISKITSLSPPDFELEEGKKYGFKIDFYYREDLVFLTQKGIFWIIEKEILKKEEEIIKKISDFTGAKKQIYFGLVAEAIGAHEEAITTYLNSIDLITEGKEEKFDIIQRLVIIFEKIYNQLAGLGWINERDQVCKNLSYWVPKM